MSATHWNPLSAESFAEDALHLMREKQLVGEAAEALLAAIRIQPVEVRVQLDLAVQDLETALRYRSREDR